MNDVINKEIEEWKRPWNLERFDDLYNRDERFFSILLKGALNWLTQNIVLYNKPILHFIFNTGSSYMYVESNGYEFSWNETSGEDSMYMQTPRCIVELGDISVVMEELSNPYAGAQYERRTGQNIKGFVAEVRRLPLEVSLSLKYVLSNFNESIILIQELIDKIIFQKYFDIVYLGQTIKCSIEFPNSSRIEINKIDMASPEINQKNINIELKICTNYPQVNSRSEIDTSKQISGFMFKENIRMKDINTGEDKITDTENLIRN